MGDNLNTNLWNVCVNHKPGAKTLLQDSWALKVVDFLRTRLVGDVGQQMLLKKNLIFFNHLVEIKKA